MADPARNDETSALVRFTVPYAYEVLFTANVFDLANSAVVDVVRRAGSGRSHRVLVVIDDGVERAHSKLVRWIQRYAEAHEGDLVLAGDPVIVAGGEQCKNDPNEPAKLHKIMLERGIDRHSFCMVIGGGAVQDMAGYAAATAHRGLRILRLPTTVLSQNDGGVGVKNGINLCGVKNFVGTFAPPFAVINDFEFLETLERRDRIGGIAEAVKVSLLRDAGFFDWLCARERELHDLKPEATRFMIEQCARLHVEHIQGSGDPFEFGSARPLDLGHWSAHKLESLSESAIRHGEAVAIGLAVDCVYAREAGLLSAEQAARVLSLLKGVGLSVYHPLLSKRDESGDLSILKGLSDFREHLGGELTVTLLRGIGQPVDVHDMDHRRIARAIGWLAQHHPSQP